MTLNSKRILAFLVDYLITAFLMVISVLLVGRILVAVEVEKIQIFETIAVTVFWLIMLIFVCRDAFGISVGKRVFKLCVKSDRIEKDWRLPDDWPKDKADWRQLVLRNITIILWPIEALMILSGSKRLGDMLAHTYVDEK